MIDPQSMVPLMDKVYAAAQPGVVFSPPVEANGYTVITASEVMAGGGFGLGSGNGQEGRGSGGGGGGGSTSRPVAVISIGPDGVNIKPVVDATKLGLAGVTAWGAIAISLFKMMRQAR
jgi:uncharacterized spore protein YtfJ